MQLSSPLAVISAKTLGTIISGDVKPNLSQLYFAIALIPPMVIPIKFLIILLFIIKDNSK